MMVAVLHKHKQQPEEEGKMCFPKSSAYYCNLEPHAHTMSHNSRTGHSLVLPL